MCQFKSCIILKDRVFVADYDGHSDMLEELHIKDTFENASNLFIRAEVIPTDDDVFSDVMSWKFRVDQDILPAWYVPNIDEVRAKEAVAKWVKAHTLSDGIYKVKSGFWLAWNNASVEAYGNTRVEAYGNARVEARNNTTIIAHDNASVIAWEKATVEASDNATVTAWDNVTVEARNKTSVAAGGCAMVEAWDNAIVTAYLLATVAAYDNVGVVASDQATVIIPKYSNSNLGCVTVLGDAVAIDHNTHVIKSSVEWGVKK